MILESGVEIPRSGDKVLVWIESGLCLVLVKFCLWALLQVSVVIACYFDHNNMAQKALILQWSGGFLASSVPCEVVITTFDVLFNVFLDVRN